MTLGRALEKCAFESRWLTGYEPWTQRLAWNLTMAALCCKAACDAYNNGTYDCHELDHAFKAGLPDPELLGPYPYHEPTKETT